MSQVQARVYLDANILIYIVEAVEPFRSQLHQLVGAMDDGRIRGVTSELTIAEVMVKPLAAQRQDAIAEYSRLFSTASPLELIAVRRDVLEKSAALRATTGGKLADAIHIATAELSNCTALLSADIGMKTPPEITLVSPAEVAQLLANLQSSP